MVEESPPKEELKEEVVYDSAGLERFLQQAELSGISLERQKELVTMLLAEDVTLEEIILDSLESVTQRLRKMAGLKLLLLLLLLGFTGFLMISEYRARRGYVEYQAWQYEVSAAFKNIQMKFLPLFDWSVLFETECVVDNPYYWYQKNHKEGVDCVDEARVLTTVPAVLYSGIFNSKKYSLPLVLSKAQDTWRAANITDISTLHQIVLEDRDKTFPCTELPGEAQPAAHHKLDPIKALIGGTLTDVDNNPVHTVLLDGCSRSSNKVLRGLTKRPAFMDSHIESLFNIKGILSKGIPEGDHVDVKVRDVKEEKTTHYMWVAQVLGSSSLTLRDCDCPDNDPITLTLYRGEILAIAGEDALSIKLGGAEESFLLYTDFLSRAED